MAVELYKGKIPIITGSLNAGFLRGKPPADLSTGAIPRDFDVDPVAMGDSPSGMQIIPSSEDDARYDEQEATKSSLLHVYLGDFDSPKPAFKFLDQDGFPDCWFHSTPHAMMMHRAAMGLPEVRFNGVAGATLLGQTDGGWCGLSMKFAREHGLPVIGTGPGEWPYQSRRGKDTPELRANMAKYKVEEDWYDLGKKEWNQDLSDRQLATCCWMNWPAPTDYNKYGHSMLTFARVRIERGRYGRATLNSWLQFGYFGVCIIDDSVPFDNAVAIRSGSASV